MAAVAKIMIVDCALSPLKMDQMQAVLDVWTRTSPTASYPTTLPPTLAPTSHMLSTVCHTLIPLEQNTEVIFVLFWTNIMNLSQMANVIYIAPM
eukprot:CAMPEP_0113527960 /NCGR_PEP_ID=MMETSP0015_2-20120614/1578_1 /TAXON_ID=2838 /ORGANISM="Odontella" /LENGTH=93 /DNA_ID=CAMNT_0000426437 /DNA_START=1379 /DNA_END=1660 /DNA_ORIENTATION=- /assembly_acc=CAM_ASM_000160